jgi:hypothetical protein
MRQYYYHDGQIEKGPYLLKELKAQYLTRSTPVWYEGLSEWTAAEHVTELNTLFSAPPPFQNNRASTPPPIHTTTAAPAYTFPEPGKRSYKLPVIIASVLALCVVGWLLYNNQSQALKIEAQSTQLQQIKNEQEEKDEKRRQINEALTKKNMQYRNNWSSYIGVSRHNANPGWSGGMESFDVFVSNKTDYMLDQVEVLVTYVKDNGGIYKTETVTFTNVPPSSEMAERAPGSSRGTYVRTEIKSIQSKKMHFCFPSNNGNPADPYFCK